MEYNIKYPFYVNGIDERVRWAKLKREIWSDFYTCEMLRHWENFDKDEHDYDTYGDVTPKELAEFIRCTYCDVSGLYVVWNLEHILPRDSYPDLAFDLDNIVLSCNYCNKKKGNKVGTPVGKLFLPYQKQLAIKKQRELIEVA